jgi:ribose/xylose/arabinose/galactoside ABC-type transport system permease subunit
VPAKAQLGRKEPEDDGERSQQRQRDRYPTVGVHGCHDDRHNSGQTDRRAGINTTAVKWIVFGISGMMAGIAGVMLVGYGAAGSTTSAGPDLLLDVISIAVIGGVSLTGGKGTVWAVLVGGLVIASLDSGLNLMATDPYYVYVIKGAILLAAILVDVVGKRSSGFSFHRLRQQLSLKSLLRT